MKRYFNVTGACDAQFHYMVDLRERLAEIKKLVDAGEYFTINRARQYGKTTTLNALAEYLQDEYIVVLLDFQKMSGNDFENEETFANSFAEAFITAIEADADAGTALSGEALDGLKSTAVEGKVPGLRKLFISLSRICADAAKPVVLMIDEVDSAANNQVFLDFLAQLRGYYLTRRKTPIFQSVILAGVYDIKNIQMKIRPDGEHKVNSPWNIAADFDVVMSFSAAVSKSAGPSGLPWLPEAFSLSSFLANSYALVPSTDFAEKRGATWSCSPTNFSSVSLMAFSVMCP